MTRSGAATVAALAALARLPFGEWEAVERLWQQYKSRRLPK